MSPRSVVAKKFVVALTGLVMLGFVAGHLLGNLQIFMGADPLNNYAAMLKNTKPLLWGTRLALLLSVFLHVLFTVQLNRLNKASRPIGYDRHQFIQASPSSRFMIFSGLVLGLYIVYHLLHLTIGSVHPRFDEYDVYANVIIGFSNPFVSGFYILAMLALGAHLHHGIQSVFQTLGLNHPKYNCWRKFAAVGVSIVFSLGYISIPVAVMLGVLK